MTIRQKLLLWYTGVLAVSGCILMLTLYFLTAHQMRREVEKFLLDECNEWADHYRNTAPDLSALERVIRPQIGTERYFPLMFRLYDPVKKADLLVIGPESWREVFPKETAFRDPGGKRVFSTQTVGRHGHGLRLLTMRLNAAASPGLVLQGGVYMKRLDRRLGNLRIFLVISVVIGIGLALAGGRFLAERSLRPMDDIVVELDRVETERLSARLGVPDTNDEVARLRTGINRMLHRLEDSFERVRGFTADAAHELRTPLASLQCRLEVALNKARSEEEYRRTVSDALAETEALTRTVNDLLLLARMDAAAEQVALEPVSLNELLTELYEVFRVAAEEKGLRLSLDCGDGCVAIGEKGLLRKLFGNVIDNAVRYTPSGGVVTVEAATEQRETVVRVTDTGIGIAPERQEKIFDRFVRVRESRTRDDGGVGLGLSICRSIVSLYRGTITVASTPGQGSTFEVRLPAA